MKKYSNFIGSPIFLNGNRQNTVEALWRKKPSEVTDEEHAKFYKFLTGAFDKPQYRYHRLCTVHSFLEFRPVACAKGARSVQSEGCRVHGVVMCRMCTATLKVQGPRRVHAECVVCGVHGAQGVITAMFL